MMNTWGILKESRRKGVKWVGEENVENRVGGG